MDEWHEPPPPALMSKAHQNPRQQATRTFADLLDLCVVLHVHERCVYAADVGVEEVEGGLEEGGRESPRSARQS